MKQILVSIFLLTFLLSTGCYYNSNPTEIKISLEERIHCDKGYQNYGAEIKKQAKRFNLPPEYLMSLVMLECSGEENPKSRFEKSIFNKLDEVKKGKRKSFENITKEDLKDASKEALENLSTSWGPFQIMGYKSIHLGIKIKELRGTVGKGEIYWGVKWIRDNYGEYLDRGDFESAFRIHNTGSPTGKTHDKNYVYNGLRYAAYFKSRYW